MIDMSVGDGEVRTQIYEERDLAPFLGAEDPRLLRMFVRVGSRSAHQGPMPGNEVDHRGDVRVDRATERIGA
ncbi:hypothetical protein GCM10023194_38740 [Planotetraspora phitsanulokensis]|uniref:Uncharacterized protein n=1 Tax=Planotetraspora phitsanulokensis TaxID=575192 RepID=A0A8J3XJV1_9ACTN|nr:hypothetical protein Pph01_85530 [Planotetraspora phitsanulokensis]